MKTKVSAKPVTNNGIKCYRVCVPQALQASEGATRKFFQNKAEAQKFADKLNSSRQSWSLRLLAMPDKDQGRLCLVLENLGWDISRLEQACAAQVKSSTSKQVLLRTAIDEYVKMKNEKVTGRHLEQTTKLLVRFSEFSECAGRTVNEITNKAFNAFLGANGWGTTSQRFAYAVIGAFFKWACKPAIGYADHNIVDATDRPEAAAALKEIFTTSEIASLLATAAKIDPEMVSYLAIGIFAGVRPDEISRMSPGMRVDDHFVLPGSITKTGQNRNVDLSSTLQAWLAKFPMPEAGWENLSVRRQAIARVAKVAWKHDAMRHSFCSYSLPFMGDSVVSMNAGHTVAVLHRHYANHVSKAELAKFQNELTPEIVLNEKPVNVLPMAA